MPIPYPHATSAAFNEPQYNPVVAVLVEWFNLFVVDDKPGTVGPLRRAFFEKCFGAIEVRLFTGTDEFDIGIGPLFEFVYASREFCVFVIYNNLI